MKYPFCPNCKQECKPYGLPYGLQIGSPDENEATDVQGVILVQCNKCGTVLGSYRDETLDKPEK